MTVIKGNIQISTHHPENINPSKKFAKWGTPVEIDKKSRKTCSPKCFKESLSRNAKKHPWTMRS